MFPVPIENRGWKKWLATNLLLILIISGVIFGAILGFALKQLYPGEKAQILLAYPGELFVRMLKLMILPLIISSLIAGSASLNSKANGKIVGRTVIYFLVTSLISAVLGVLLVIAIHPGTPLTKQSMDEGSQAPTKMVASLTILDGFLDLGRNMVPDNLFQAAFQQLEYRDGTNTLGIIVFCLVFGTILGSMKKKAAVVIDFFSVLDEAILRIVTLLMWFTPVGVASIILSKILAVENLTVIVSNLGLFMVTVLSGVFIYQLIILNLIYFILIRKNPFSFYLKLMEPWMTSFATASTAATLPITFKTMKEKCGVDPRISRFVLPIGATVNMDGTALFVSVASIFIAQMRGVSLDVGQYATIAITATAVSVAAASVPSAALVLILIILTTVGIPSEDVTLLFTIDWLLDRFRTTNNCLGDCYAAAIIEKLSKKELEEMDAEVEENHIDVEKAYKLAVAGGTVRNGVAKQISNGIPIHEMAICESTKF